MAENTCRESVARFPPSVVLVGNPKVSVGIYPPTDPPVDINQFPQPVEIAIASGSLNESGESDS